jgi:hypothetical protein
MARFMLEADVTPVPSLTRVCGGQGHTQGGEMWVGARRRNLEMVIPDRNFMLRHLRIYFNLLGRYSGVDGLGARTSCPQ